MVAGCGELIGDHGSWIKDGVALKIGKPERRAEHATERSEVECEDRSGGFPIFAASRVRGHAACGVAGDDW